MSLNLQKYGSLGAIIAAAACPICFPKLALIGALIGLGALAQYEFYFFIAAQFLVLVVLAGILWAYRDLRNIGIPLLALVSVGLFFVSLYLIVSEYLSYIALVGLISTVIWQIADSKKCLASENNAKIHT